MVIFPKAKINIGLRITGKRPDGFHDLETIFYPVCLHDALEFVVPGKQLKHDSLVITGSLSDTNPDNNLVMKAVLKLREIYTFPFLSIHLHKAIPAGAGLGGGSSDASFILKALNRHFNLGLGRENLKVIALDLGSDCPFFIDGKPAFAEGRGELMTEINPVREALHLVLVNPGIHINTREAFGDCNPARPESDLKELYEKDISEWKSLIINDFERPVFNKHPQIGEIKAKLYDLGALYSSMSGSGSTVYGLFRSIPVLPATLQNNVIYSGRL